ncbi:hypothetical protein M758_7G016900 [Ceratodon purpureus]|nr:hypothetical protein M758_7G016900 [Ceratodon purpureus]
MSSLVDSSLRRGRGLLLRSGSSSSKRMAVMETRTGELLLGLVSRGQALVAELLRLSQHVPAVLQQSASDSGGKYAALLFDFKYFKSPEVYEEQVEASSALAVLDDEFREECGNVVERFFLLFDGIAKYYKDLSRFVDDLLQDGAGAFLQETAESVLEDEEGRQLLMEALMLHGVLLLLLEHRLPGSLREHLLVAHCRCRGSSDFLNFEAIQSLCRCVTPSPKASSAFASVASFASFLQGSSPPSATEPNMILPSNAEEMCNRFPLPRRLMRLAVARLRSDDLYNQLRHYPNPEHRCAALGGQAACLYVLLNFIPEILQSEALIMKDIVDKFLLGWWVVPIFMGFMVDLSVAWDQYKAAKAALAPMLAPQQVREFARIYGTRVPELLVELRSMLSEGVLTQEFVLSNMATLVACLRDSNIALRWLLLHQNTTNKKLKEMVVAVGGANGSDLLLSLILETATLEFELKRVYGDLLEGKEAQWLKCKNHAAECMQELADFFSGSKVLSRKVKDENMQNWFLQMGQQVRALECKLEASRAVRKIQQMILALQEVEQFHQIESSLQIKQYLAETRAQLQQMVRTLNVQEGVLATISVVSDAAYAWGLIVGFTPQIHARIHAEPFTVLKLSCLFLKLRSILDIPLLRISQSGSMDLYSVSEYYSSELVAYVRSVMEIIPVSMFSILNDVIAVQTKQLHELPGRLEKESLRDFAQPEERYKLAKATHRVAVFTQGIMAMKKTFMGAIEVDPWQLLEIGIRKQLVKQVATSLHTILVFPTSGVVELEEQLQELLLSLQAQRRSMEYFQDYVHVHGLQLWHEEFARIIDYNTEQECNAFVKRKVQNWQSVYQDPAKPIPQFPAPAKDSSMTSNFMGRLAHKLLQLTDPSRSMYLVPMSGWFDAQGQELVGLRTMALLQTTLGTAGLTGLDRLLGFQVTHAIRQAVMYLSSRVESVEIRDCLESLESVLTPNSSIPDPGSVVYTEYSTRAGMNAPGWNIWVENVSRIGQIQLLRCLLGSHLRASAKFESSTISYAVDAMNKAVLGDIMDSRGAAASGVENTEVKSRLLGELRKQLQLCGLYTPFHSIYITTKPADGCALLLFLVTISQLPRYVLDSHLGTLTSRMKKAALDCCPLIVGIGSILQQLHPSRTTAYVRLLGQYVRTYAESPGKQDKSSAKEGKLKLPNEVVNVVAWVLALSKYMSYPQDLLTSHFPPLLLDSLVT